MGYHADKTRHIPWIAGVKECFQNPKNKNLIRQNEENQPLLIAQNKIKFLADNNLQALQMKAYQQMANNRLQERYFQQGDTENKAGLPDNLKTGIENLSSYSMDDVKVHYNSNKPAQLHAHAYAQGTDIHVAPGQENIYLMRYGMWCNRSRERLKPTLKVGDKLNINDNTLILIPAW